MKQKKWKRAASLLLTLMMMAQTANLPVLADAVLPDYIPFDDAVISPESEEQNLFLFGSRNMTVSEKSGDRRLMKIVRTGDCAAEASVTLKFTDVSARYGENYTVSVYGGSEKPEEAAESVSLVDFMTANADSQTEETPLTNEEMAALLEKNGGCDVVDTDGRVLSSVLIGEDADRADEQDVTELAELAAMDELYEPLALTAADEGMIDDSFPGTELTLSFGAGEREKAVVIRSRYSEEAQGDCTVSVSLKNPSEGYAVPEDGFSALLTITDEDEHDAPVLSLAEDAYTADGNAVEITVTRTGAINEFASARVIASPETARAGLDFAGMDAELDFAPGLTSRTVTIPVQHTSEEELTFRVKLTSPVNASLDRTEAVVAITPEEAFEPDGMMLGAVLSADSTDRSNPDYTPYLAESLTPKDFTPFGNAWNTDRYWFKYSCKGVDYDTWNGGTYLFDNPYLYDGIRIRWQADHSGLFSTSYTYINTDGRHALYREGGSWDDTTEDVIFGCEYNRKLCIESLTSYFNGISVDVKKVAPIYRTFNFRLAEADPMTFEGVDAATAKTFTAVQFTDQIASVRTVNKSVGGFFSVSVPGTQKETVRLVGLSFLDRDGKELYYLSNPDADRTVSVVLTKGLLSALAVSTLEYTRLSDGRYEGNVTVKPVFEYIDAEVVVRPSEFGAFAGEFGTENTEKTLSFHVGDRLTLSSVTAALYEGRYTPDGVRYETRDEEGRLLQNGSGSLDYGAEGSLIYTVDCPKLVLTPTFRENNNAVTVLVRKSDVDSGRFDPDSGIFLAYRSRSVKDGYYSYIMTDSSVHLDQLVCLNAVPADSRYTAVWTLPGAAHDYSGSVFYHTAAREAADNIITLSLAEAETYSFSGSVFHADKNLATGRGSAVSAIPADGALIAADGRNVSAREDGSFELNGTSGVPGTCGRLLIWADNRFTVRDVYLNPAQNDYNLGAVTAASNTPDGAYFTGVIFTQSGVTVRSSETLFMNGGRLTMTASVQDGNRYEVGGEVYTERVTGVTFRILDGTTHEIKSSYPASENGDGSWTAVIPQFSPESPDEYTYGDSVYVSMTTDRIRGLGTDENGEIPEAFRSTDYAMLSTGYEIIRDDSYEPQMFSLNLLSAAQVLGGNTKREYVTLPFIGALDTVVGVLGRLGAPISMEGEADAPYAGDDDFDDDFDDGIEPDEPGADPGSGKGYSHTQIRVTVSFEKLPYGGTRIKFGVTATVGNRAFWNSAAANPLDTKGYIFGDNIRNTGNVNGLLHGGIDHIYNNPRGELTDMFSASLGTPRMTFHVYFGLYVDFGVIQETDLSTGSTELDWELLGGGGFLSGTFQVEWQWMTLLGYVPAFAGVVGTAGGGGTLGITRNPDEVLKYDELMRKSVFDANELHIDPSLFLNASVKGYIGLGVPDFLGARIILGLNAAFSYEPLIRNLYPAVDNRYGLGLELTLGGQLDLFLFRLPAELFSWPFFSMGYTDYFVLLKRANKLVDYTVQELDQNGSRYPDALVSEVRDLVDRLNGEIRNGTTQENLQTAFDRLLDTVYNDRVNIITDLEYASIFYLASPMDVWFTDYDSEAEADSALAASPASLNSAENSWERIGSTESRWAANDKILRGTFTGNGMKKLVEDSYTQTSAQMLDLGDGRILTAFLMDTSSGSDANPTLVLSVYDADTGAWSEPVTVQNDGTPDFSPNLCDAGDRVLLTWSSLENPADAYDSDGALLRDLELYAAFLDRNTLTVSEPERLTDDEYMDSRSAAAYDEESGDLIVYYVKNVEASSDNPADYTGAASIVTYRLYTEADGWIVDYYETEMPDATAEERQKTGEEWGGQRFLTSVGEGDLPITELAVCEGYNDLAVFAYTVDTDGNPATEADTELYLRVYEYSTHRTFKPIRVTNDSVSQSLPQLIRNTVPYRDYTESSEGAEVGGTTYLFWLEDVNQVKYISVTDLIRNGILDNGTLREDYRLNPVTIDTSMSGGEPAAVDSYQALTDAKNNLYLLWSQTCAENVTPDNVGEPAAKEIFAAAKIRTEPDGGEINGRESVIGGSWSAPVQLTDSGVSNDSVRGAVTEDGTLCLTCNRWTVDYIGDDPAYQEANPLREDGTRGGNPYIIGPTDFMALSFEPDCSVEATEFVFSDPNPAAGDDVSVTVKIENTGLTSAEGYTVSFYESKDGARGRKIGEFTSDEWLAANTFHLVELDWTVPADFDGMQILAVCEEEGYAGAKKSYSDPLTAEAVYEIRADSLEQTGETFTAQFTVKNTGNADADEDDRIEIRFAALYGRYDTVYGLENALLASVPLDGLRAKEEMTGSVSFFVPASAFDYCGYDEAVFTVTDGDGNPKSNAASEFLVPAEVVTASFAEDSLSLTAGQTADANVVISGRLRGGEVRILYASSDESVLTVDENGRITAVGAGIAEVTAHIQPSGTEITLPVSVSGSLPDPEPEKQPCPIPLPRPLPKMGDDEDSDESGEDDAGIPDVPADAENPFGDVFPNDYYYDAVLWALESGVTTGVSDSVFLPLGACTRAQTVTFLWRAAGCPEPQGECAFADVPAESWYAKAVCWAAENGVTKGTGETTFSPDRTVTRAETVTFLFRFAGAAAGNGENPFRDVAESDYYYDAVLWAAEEGITNGTDSHTFSPDAVCTRAQIVTFLCRLMNR